MPIAIANLPDDIETLKRLVIEQQALIAEREHQFERARETNDVARVELERKQAEALHLRTWI